MEGEKRMTFQDNVLEILHCSFPTVKEEVLQLIAKNICRLMTPETNNYGEGYIDGFNDGCELERERRKNENNRNELR
jgi:hypothetical protein